MTVRAVARVNLAAIERNVARLRRELAPGVALCAVVKADGYGHGALPAGRAALAGGAGWLAVVGAQEAAQLRAGGIEAPILLMGALSPSELDVALAAGADVVAGRSPSSTRSPRVGAGRCTSSSTAGWGASERATPSRRRASRARRRPRRASGWRAR